MESRKKREFRYPLWLRNTRFIVLQSRKMLAAKSDDYGETIDVKGGLATESDE